MKTAISIPDDVFRSAEGLADQLGQSRSQLYTQALTTYLEQHRNDHLTRKLDQVYAETESSLEAGLSALQDHALTRDKW